MIKSLKSLFFFIFLPSVFLIEVIKPYSESTIKIAFGGGNKKNIDDKSKIFYSVARYNPDVWIWLGDSAYLDDRVVYGLWAENKNLTNIRMRYKRSKSDSGIWNDHDYGLSEGDGNFSQKNDTKRIFLDFLGEERGSERREHHEGVYNSYYLGEKKRVKLILLDVRYNKMSDDILGEKQWKWLEKNLWDNDALVTVFASGMQIMPDDRYFLESWDESSRDKLYKLLKKTNTKGPIILSGDAGYGEIMMNPCSKKILGLDLYEATSHGLTNSMSEDIPFGQYFQTFLFPETYNKAEDRYNKKNFGILEIRFSDSSIQDTQIHIEIRNDVGTSSVSKYFDLESISPDVKRRKEALKEECKAEKSVNTRKILQILGRLKQFDIFFLFVLSLPFVTVWLVYISCKQFYEIFSTCCSDEGLQEEQDEMMKAQEEQEENEGEEEGEGEEEEEGEGEEEKKNELENKENDEKVLNPQKNDENKEDDEGKSEKSSQKSEKLEKQPLKKVENTEEDEWKTVKKKTNPRHNNKKNKLKKQ